MELYRKKIVFKKKWALPKKEATDLYLSPFCICLLGISF